MTSASAGDFQRSDMVVGEIRRRPRVTGVGLVALDVVYGLERDCAPNVYAGGTCSNVVAALAFLGWESYPVARLANDAAGVLVLADLERCGVRIDFVALSPRVNTPVVIQRLRLNSEGRVVHGFSLRCPGCGRWLPQYRAVPRAALNDVFEALTSSDVFFVDRLSPAAVETAEAAYARGALVYFEPSARCSLSLLNRMIEVTHILKYSSDQSDHLNQLRSRRAIVPLEVETLGAAGLRYRGTMFSSGKRGWHAIPSFFVPQLRDPAGAGDWATAGLIDFVGQAGAAGFEALPRDIVEDGLLTGQAFSAWACCFEGPRRGMYEEQAAKVRARVVRILETGRVEEPTNAPVCESRPDVFGELCGTCAEETAQFTA
jgi:sugar/nucleoside kinase (ribokinase family)